MPMKPGHTKTWLVLHALFALALLSTRADAGESDALGVESQITSLKLDQNTVFGTMKIRLLNRSSREYDCRMVVEATSYNRPQSRVEKRFALQPGETEQEVTLYINEQGYGATVQFHIDGRHVRELNDHESLRGSSSKGFLFVVGDPKRQMVDALAKSSSHDIVEQNPDDLPQHWQSYLGLRSPFVLHTTAVAKLSPAQRTALAHWVRWGGGTISLFGPDPLPSLVQLRLPYTHAANANGEFSFNCGEGHVRYAPTANLLQQAGFSTGSFLPSNNHMDKFSSLHQPPLAGYAGISVLLALLIGPVNFLFLRRRRKQAWFYFTAPALGMMGMVGLFTFSVVHDGLGVKMNEQLCLIHDQTDDTGAMYHNSYTYAGMTPSTVMSYGTDVAVLPFLHGKQTWDSIRFDTLLDQGQRLTGGWVAGRQFRGITTIQPLSVRMGVELLRADKNSVTIRNSLPTPLHQAWVSHNGTIYHLFNPLPSGETARIMTTCPASQVKPPSWMPSLRQWDILAQTESLPYVDNGGLTGEVRERDCYYIGIVRKDDARDEPGQE